MWALAAITCFVFLSPAAHSQGQVLEIAPSQAEVAIPEMDDPLTSVDVENIEVNPALRALVQQLDDESYEVREQASKAISAGDFELSHVCSLLLDDTLSLEQRHRVLGVAREVLLRTPRGALGIEMRTAQPFNNVAGEIEIEVVRLLPGLPAERVLRVGDRITEIDGVPLRRNDDLIRYTQVRQPGSPVRLTVRRIVRAENGEAFRDPNDELRYERVEVTLELGSADLLREANGNVQRSGPVLQQREIQAIRLARNYGTKPDRLELEPGAKSLQTPKPVAAIRNADDWAEEHHYIKELRRDMKFIASGAMDRQQRGAIWNQRLFDLQQMIEDANTSPEDRDYLRRVQQRFLEIVTNVP